MKKITVGMLLIFWTFAVWAIDGVTPQNKLTFEQPSTVRMGPPPGPDEKQLTCEEIDEIPLIPYSTVEISPYGGRTAAAVNGAIGIINAHIQYKKDFCNGKIKPEPIAEKQ